MVARSPIVVGMSQLLSAQQAAARLAVSRRTFFRLVKKSGFPAPVRLGSRMVRYAEDELSRWVDQHRDKG